MVIRVDDNNGDASMHDAKSLAALHRSARDFRSSAITSGLPSTITTSTLRARGPQVTNRPPNHRFIPRPFPPPALADVPLEYIIDQLRRLAPHYWSRPETSDCTIGMCSALLSSSQTISHFTVRQLCLWTTRVLIRCQHLPVCAMRSATWTSVPRCLRICMDSRTLLGAPLGSL